MTTSLVSRAMLGPEVQRAPRPLAAAGEAMSAPARACLAGLSAKVEAHQSPAALVHCRYSPTLRGVMRSRQEVLPHDQTMTSPFSPQTMLPPALALILSTMWRCSQPGHCETASLMPLVGLWLRGSTSPELPTWQNELAASAKAGRHLVLAANLLWNSAGLGKPLTSSRYVQSASHTQRRRRLVLLA